MLDSGSYLSLVMSLLLKKVIIPTEFHERAFLVEQMLECDSAGLVDSLTQFQVDCANVDIRIDTESEPLNKTLNDEWLDNINKEFRGKGIETGLKGLMKEYLKERWRGGSFPVLKILRWGEINGIDFPISMVFAKGADVWAKDKDAKEQGLTLFSYDYFIGKDEEEQIEGEAYLMYKPFSRWFDKYTVPYLIRRGVYKNWKIIDMIKNKEIELVDRIIPYMLLILKGSEQLTEQGITYNATELEGVKTKVQELINKLNQVELTEQGHLANKTPIRVTNFDEEFKHLIPDMKTLFERELFVSAERHILAGLGFIDVIDAVSTSRRESILNPKAFLKEVNTGISDFTLILKDLVSLIKEKNEDARKYNAQKWIIDCKPVTEFATDDFLVLIRSLSDRGIVSNELADTICSQGKINYELEVRKRTREAREGHDYIMYPKIIQNVEQAETTDEMLRKELKGKFKTPEDQTKDFITEDKKGIEKENFNQAMLEEFIDDELVFSMEEEAELVISKKWDKERITEKYIRIGQVAPDKFQKKSFRTIWLSPSKGIKAIIGRLQGEKTTTVQSYLFVKDKWTKQEAKEWVDKRETEDAELTGAPYSEINDLPPSVKKRLDIGQQRKWLEIWNSAYRFYLKKFKGDIKQAETLAFRTAWSKVK